MMLIIGGLAPIQHVVLRMHLQRLKFMPWNYPQFLDYAADHILLRKVGGGYMFRHRLLLDYFANLETKPNLDVSVQSKREILDPDATLSASAALNEKEGYPNIIIAMPVPLLAESSLLPCGHEWRPYARFCAICGAPIRS